jgi:hypothetical protein
MQHELKNEILFIAEPGSHSCNIDPPGSCLLKTIDLLLFFQDLGPQKYGTWHSGLCQSF